MEVSIHTQLIALAKGFRQKIIRLRGCEGCCFALGMIRLMMSGTEHLSESSAWHFHRIHPHIKMSMIVAEMWFACIILQARGWQCNRNTSWCWCIRIKCGMRIYFKIRKTPSYQILSVIYCKWRCEAGNYWYLTCRCRLTIHEIISDGCEVYGAVLSVCGSNGGFIYCAHALCRKKVAQ